MSLRIVTATPSDLPELVRLNLEVQRLHARLSPDVFLQDCDERELADFWGERLGETQSRVRLAKLDDRAAGYVWFEIQDRPRTLFKLPRRRIYVHHIGVSALHRRMGVGVALLNDVEAAARDLGIPDLELDASAANAVAMSFFERRGYRRRYIVMSKRLDG